MIKVKKPTSGKRDKGRMISLRTASYLKLKEVAEKEDRTVRSMMDKLLEMYDEQANGK